MATRGRKADRIRALIDAVSRAADGDLAVRAIASGAGDDIDSLVQAVDRLLAATAARSTAARGAEVALSLSTSLLDGIVDQSPYPMWISDGSGTLIRINQACRQLLQVAEEEVVGRYNVLRDEVVERQGFTPLVRRVFEAGETARFEIAYDSSQLRHLRLRESAAVVLDTTIFPVRDAGGRTRNAVIQHVDVTARKLTEAALRESEERFRRLFQSNVIGIVVADSSGRIHDANDVFLHLVGYSRAELPLRGEEVTPPEWRAADARARQELSERGEAAAYEKEYVRKNGDRIPILIGGVRTEDVADWVVYFVIDLTERKRAEAALRQREAQYRTIIETAEEGIWAIDAEGRTSFVNPKMARMLGYTVEEMLGQPLSAFVPENERVVAAENLKRRRTGVSEQHEYRLLRKDGSVLWARLAIGPLTDGAGLYAGALAMATDITMQKEQENERARLESALRQAQKMESIGRLAGGIAHDFNNMLAIILGQVELMQRALPPHDPLLARIAEIERAGLHARDITRQLLAFSRKEVIEPRPVDLNGLIADTQASLLRLIGEDIALRFLPGKDLWGVMCDPSQVSQILINLALNARDAMPDGGRVTVETANVNLTETFSDSHPGCTPGRWVRLRVSDDGVGMDEETLAHAFEPFYTTKAVGKGTGLGLATVYGIVKQNGGCIDVSSQPGKGSTFEIHLPEGAAVEAAAEPTETPLPDPKPGTVLLVEDDPAVRYVVAEMLKSMCYAVLEASDAEEALSICDRRQAAIDLLVTDVVMPGMSGTQLVERLRTIVPGLRVLLMSGYASNKVARPGTLPEGVLLIQKPFGIDDLSRRIHEIHIPRRGSA